MYTNADCTIFHQIYDTDTMQNTYVGFYIDECFWDSESEITRISDGVENSDSVFIMIPDVSNYVGAKAYKNLETKGDYWTIEEGDKIVKGEISLDTAVKDLESTYDDVFTVTNASPKLYGSDNMQHIEAGGK